MHLVQLRLNIKKKEYRLKTEGEDNFLGNYLARCCINIKLKLYNII